MRLPHRRDPGGMLNAIGLQGIGVHRFVAEKLPELRRLGATVIVNICGSTLDEYIEIARVLSDHEVSARLSSTFRVPTSRKAAFSSDAACTERTTSSAASARSRACP
jgi:dihydroorotate dehydrogenase (NAD+) catalytic subunit